MHHAAARLTGLAVLMAALTLPALAAEAPASIESQLAALKAENEQLRTLLPSQSHAMIDVAYHFTNLWFAGRAENWPLAQFYLNESRNRIAWALRIVPVRKISTGDLALQPIFEAFDKAQIAELRKAIAEKDVARFATAYESGLAGCTGCHVAAEKPFLKLAPPKAPEGQLVQFSP